MKRKLLVEFLGMETISVVGPQKSNHGYTRNRSRGLTKFASFGSPSLDDFQGINCRAFQSGAGLLPTPFQSSYKTKPVTRKNTSLSPKTPSPFVNENRKGSKTVVRSNPVDIPIKIDFQNKEGDFCFSELWAGPAYSNSPPPSSLPIPKFSVRPKRTVSLELPGSAPEVDLQPMSKSAPASPTRERSPSPYGLTDCGDVMTKTFSARDLFDTADSATMTLRRILNLDINGE